MPNTPRGRGRVSLATLLSPADFRAARAAAADASPAGRAVIVPCGTYCLHPGGHQAPDRVVADEREIDRARAAAANLHARIRGVQ